MKQHARMGMMQQQITTTTMTTMTCVIQISTGVEGFAGSVFGWWGCWRHAWRHALIVKVVTATRASGRIETVVVVVVVEVSARPRFARGGTSTVVSDWGNNHSLWDVAGGSRVSVSTGRDRSVSRINAVVLARVVGWILTWWESDETGAWGTTCSASAAGFCSTTPVIFSCVLAKVTGVTNTVSSDQTSSSTT